MSVAERAAGSWQRYEIRQIEDLCNAVLGADLEAVQLSGPRVRGSLAFAAEGGIVYSSGLIDGRVSLRGTLSHDAMTVAIFLRIGQGSRNWLQEVQEGDVGLFLAGAKHDATYAAGSLYIAVTLTPERLQQEAAREGIELTAATLARSGLHGVPLQYRDLVWLRSGFTHLHDARFGQWDYLAELKRTALRAIILHYGRVPQFNQGFSRPVGKAHAVHRAIEYIRDNLADPIAIETLVSITQTSRRTLFRAFLEVLDDTPQNFIRRLRLHRIRRDLVRGAGDRHTIADIARSWGAGADLGRLSARYQQLFGENPSVTLSFYRERPWQAGWL